MRDVAARAAEGGAATNHKKKRLNIDCIEVVDIDVDMKDMELMLTRSNLEPYQLERIHSYP